MPALPFPLPSPLVSTSPIPPTLVDPVPGNIGLVGTSSLLLHFDEPDGVFLNDDAGNLQDLGLDAFSDPAPVSEYCWAGKGRRFDGSSMLYSPGDITGKSTLQLRDVTVMSILALRVGSSTASGMYLIARGASGSFDYGVKLSAAAGIITVTSLWSDTSAANHTDAGATYQHPGDSDFVLLTVTRRWNSTTSVTFRYYAGDLFLGETTSTAGSIAGSTASPTWIGGLASAGGLKADVDELRVVPYEMSADEVRETWRRLAVHQPNGVSMFAGLQPPGSKWYADPGNRIGRLTKISGELLGYAIAKIEELRENWLPDQAYAEWITRWEGALKISPKPRDSLDTRRARVISFLSRLRGFSAPAIRQVLSELFAQDASDVQLLRFSNRIVDDLSAAATTPERWEIATGNNWTSGSGTTTLHVAASGAAGVWPDSAQRLTASIPASSLQRFARFGRGAIIAQVKLASLTNQPSGNITGLFLADRISKDALWFGVSNVSGTAKIGYQTYTGATGVLSAFVSILNPAPSLPIWLRVRPTTMQDASFSPVLGYSTTSATTGFTESTPGLSLSVPTIVGPSSLGGTVGGSAFTAAFASFVLLAYRGDRTFRWYGYRDPAAPGSPDIVGALIALNGAKPAHTWCSVCQNTSVLCDDARDGLCDRGPMGSL